MIFIGLSIVAIFLIYALFGSEKSQFFGTFPWHIQTNEKIVALTFDDGPNEPYTMQLVEYLNSKSIQATFFQVGKNAQKHPEVTRRIADSGHVIGNHSLSHRFRNYLLNPKFEQEIVASQAIFKDILGKEPALFRPPWLWRYPALFGTLKKHGLMIVSGTFCHPLEVFHIAGDTIAKQVLRSVRPGSIIIFHDGYNAKGASRTETVAAVKLVVEELQDRGYDFVTVSQLLRVDAYR